MSLRILDTENGHPISSILGEATTTDTLPFNSSGNITFDFLDDGIELVSGQLFAISMKVLSPDCDFRWAGYSSAQTGTDPYEYGMLYYASPTSQGYYYNGSVDNDMTFRTFVEEFVDTDGDGVKDNDDAFPNDPTETVDTDGDGVGDNGDAFPNSILTPTVVISTCDTEVANAMLEDGSTFSDLINEAQLNSTNHNKFKRAVSKLTGKWKKDGLITGKDKANILSCT